MKYSETVKVMFCGDSGRFPCRYDDKTSPLIYLLAFISTVQNCKMEFYYTAYSPLDCIANRLVCAFSEKFRRPCKNIFVSAYADRRDVKKGFVYDEVFCPAASNYPEKFAMAKLNYWLASNADVMVCNVRRNKGNGFELMRITKKMSEDNDSPTIIDLQSRE
jgi:hypothetical protein